ncbi:thioredoxin-like protein [Fomes fomentarius]|nr:thioredoxin-like protein [Fomes fomentarius]
MKAPASRPWTGSPYRRRRILWILVLLTLAGIFYFTQYDLPSFLSLPSSLKDMGFRFSPDSSRAGRVAQAKAEAEEEKKDVLAYAGEGAYVDVREIDALVHFITAHPDRRLEGGVDAQKPVDLQMYAPDGNYDWKEHTKRVKEQHPLVVFSKTYCPYSQRAKELLGSYELEPAPKIVELNVRTDGEQVQAILARLTGRRTVPNVLLKGSSIGGSDDIHALHKEHRLKRLLEEGGVSVKGHVDES